MTRLKTALDALTYATVLLLVERRWFVRLAEWASDDRRDEETR